MREDLGTKFIGMLLALLESFNAIGRFWKEAVFLCGSIVYLNHPALAQEYPASTIRLVVPYSAGGPIDLVARGLAERMSEHLRQSVVVENKPGADEIIASSAVARAPKDGYTLMVVTEQALVLNKFLHKKLPYDPERDFIPVSRLTEGHTVLVVPADSKIKSVGEFVRAAKQDPGGISYAWSGVNRIPMGAFTQMTGISVNYVGYKGGMAAIVQDLLGGRVDATLAAQVAVAQHINSGRIRALAVSGKARSVTLPHVPTFAEAGYPDYSAAFYIGLVAPAGTPSVIVEKLATVCRSIIQEPAFVQKFLVPSGLEPIADGPTGFAAFLRIDRASAEKRVQAAGMKPE